jgi:hypothetical protein
MDRFLLRYSSEARGPQSPLLYGEGSTPLAGVTNTDPSRQLNTTKPGWLARLSYCGTGSSVLSRSASQNFENFACCRVLKLTQLREIAQNQSFKAEKFQGFKVETSNIKTFFFSKL